MADGLRVTLCVDALQHQLGGIGRYTLELARRLPNAPGIGQVRYLANHRLLDDVDDLVAGLPIRRGNKLRQLADRRAMTRAMRSTIVHAPNYFLPPKAAAGMVTIHDLSVFKFPETHPIERRRQFESLFLDSLTRARHIITDTETVREEVIEAFGISSDRITAIHLGVSDRFHPIDSNDHALLREIGLIPGEYVLCVSALEPRKKVAELIRVWSRLPANLQHRFPLVLAGGSGWENDELHRQIAQGIAEGSLIHLGHVAEAALPAIYAGAALFVYPSIYEGFGLPPIEAMASGVPVIVANRSCLPEVCGSAAMYVNPDDDNDFLNKIVEALTNNRWRSETVQNGLARCINFTWERCITDTVHLYRRLADLSLC